MRPGMWFAGIAVVAFLVGGRRYLAAGSPLQSADSTHDTSSDSAKRKSSSASKQGADSVRAVSLLHEFFGGHFRAGASPIKYQIDVLIATLPDPTDSHNDWTYDTYLESLRRAFETAGFVLDRFWIPGPTDSLAQRSNLTSKVARRDWEPGILLFRDRDPSAMRLRMLLIVPETPSGGISREAFRAALASRKAVLRGCKLPLSALDPHTIRIVGPSFSGSALSLQTMLRREMDTAEVAEIITGSATDPANQRALDLPGLRMHFRATINSDASLTRALNTLVLKPLHVPGSRVALLRESSQYGLSVSSQSGRNRGVPSPSDSFLSIAFPMSISSLRIAYAESPVTSTATTGLTIPTPKPKLGLDLIEATRSKEDLPTRSPLTAPTVDLLFDEIAGVLRQERIRLVGLMATDIRDKLFLAAELRRRVRDIQFFTFESNILFLRPDWRSSLAGMLVLSTYPLTLTMRSQFETGSHRRSRPVFANDGAEGTYNAALLQLGLHEQLLDYDTVLDEPRIGRPPVWLTAVGRGAFLPFRQFVDTGQDASSYMAAGSAALGAPARRIGTPSQASAQPQKDSPGAALQVGGLQLLAVVLSSLVLVWLALKSWKQDRQIRRTRLAGPTDPVTAPRAPKEFLELQDEVRDGSLALHERLYSTLRLVAVTGIWLAATGLLFRGLWDIQSKWRWLLLILAVGVCVSIVLAAISAGRLFGRLWSPGRAYFRELNLSGVWSATSSTAGGVESAGESGPGSLPVPTKTSWVMEFLGRAAVVVFGLFYFGFSVWFACIDPARIPDHQLLYLRASNIESLLTPLVPLLASGLAFTAWCSWHLTRISLLQRETAFGAACSQEAWQSYPTPKKAREDLMNRQKQVARYSRACWNSLFLVFPHAASYWLALGLVPLACVWLMPEFSRTLESMTYPAALLQLTGFDWLLRLSILAGFLTTLWAVIRLLAVWGSLRVCLDELTVLPLVRGFKALPEGVKRLARLSLPGRNLAASVGATSIMQWHQLRQLYKDAGAQPFIPQDLKDQVSTLMEGDDVYPRDDRNQRPPAKLVEKVLLLQEILAGLWSHEKLMEPTAPGGEGNDAPKASEAAAPETLKLFREKAELYLATQVVGYAEWVVAHLRVLALFLLLSLVLTTLILYSYPFQPQGLVRLLFTFIMLVAVGSVIYVSIQMNRHELLSIIAGTGPGVVSWDARLVVNLLTFALIPLLTLLGSALPGLRSAALSWAEPLQKLFQP